MAGIVVEMSGDEAKLWRSFQKIAQQQANLESGFKRVGQAGRQAGSEAGRAGDEAAKAGKKGSDAFGAGAVSQLQAYAAGFLSLTAVIGGTTKALTDMAEANKKAGEVTRGAAPGFSGLAQLAALDAFPGQKLNRLTGYAKDLYKAGGAADLNEAANTIFQLESAGATGERDFFAKAYQLTDTAALAEAGGKIRAAMGEKEAGSFQQILSKGLAAAGPLPGVSASSIVQATTRGASWGKLLGLSDEEVMAATSVVGQATESVEMGGTQVSSLLKTLVAKGYGERMKGASLSEMLADVRGQGMAQDELVTWFGRAEAASGFLALDDKKYQERLGAIQAAQENDWAGQMIHAAQGNELIAMTTAERRSKAGRELSELRQGYSNQLANAMGEDFRANLRNQGYGDAATWALTTADSTYRWMFGDQTYMDQTMRGGQGGQSGEAASRFRPDLGEDEKERQERKRLTDNMGRFTMAVLRMNLPTLVPPNVDR